MEFRSKILGVMAISLLVCSQLVLAKQPEFARTHDSSSLIKISSKINFLDAKSRPVNLKLKGLSFDANLKEGLQVEFEEGVLTFDIITSGDGKPIELKSRSLSYKSPRDGSDKLCELEPFSMFHGETTRYYCPRDIVLYCHTKKADGTEGSVILQLEIEYLDLEILGKPEMIEGNLFSKTPVQC